MSSSVNALFGLSKLEQPSTKIDVESFINLHSVKQQEFLRCPDNNILFYGGRRAGKTLAVCSKIVLIDQEAPKNADIIMASSTLDKIRVLYWNKLVTLNARMRLGWDFRSGANKILTPNREIFFHGLRDTYSTSVPMGRSVVAVIIEESHCIRNDILERYIRETVRPFFMEFKNSYRLILALNPPIGRLEYLHSIFHNDEWKKIQISSKDNPSPAIQNNFQAHLEREAKLDGFKNLEEAMKAPKFQRTILGLWVYENNRIVINTKKVSTFDKVPGERAELTTVIGVDIGGGRAYDAVVVLQYSKYDNKVYCVDEWEDATTEKDWESLAKTLTDLIKKYTYRGKVPVLVMDTGGLGGRFLFELRKRYKAPNVLHAKKKEKIDFLMIMKTEAEKGRLLFMKHGSLLMKEFPQIFFDETFTEIDEHNSIHSDLLDACLYSYRALHNQMPMLRPEKLSITQQMKREAMKNSTKPENFRFKHPRSKKRFLREQ